jgi:hypothetical protein
MTDIIVRIMAEFLSVLALATKQVKQGRFSKYVCPSYLEKIQCTVEIFAKRLFGRNEVESVLQKLDRLTQDGARVASAQTLGAIHGFVNNMSVVIGGAQ